MSTAAPPTSAVLSGPHLRVGDDGSVSVQVTGRGAAVAGVRRRRVHLQVPASLRA